MEESSLLARIECTGCPSDKWRLAFRRSHRQGQSRLSAICGWAAERRSLRPGLPRRGRRPASPPLLSTLPLSLQLRRLQL